jgi:DNA processing protein
VDYCYPTENIELYQEICKSGGIISEYPPATKPLSWHFPQRNRIISGLADKVLVIEAKEKSGSLITVEWALEQGKDIMAVPGRIGDRLSSGCNRLIKAGAGIITSADDVLEDFPKALNYKGVKKKEHINIEEKLLEKDLTLVYSELSSLSQSIYELMKNTGLEYGVLTERLLQLQLMGLVEETTKGYYMRLEK